jgi:hypothetical protein
MVLQHKSMLETWYLIGYAIHNLEFTRQALIKANPDKNIKSQLSKAIRFAAFIDSDKRGAKALRAKYQSNQLLHLDDAYSRIPKTKKNNKAKVLSQEDALKKLFASSAFKALPLATQKAIRKASK